MSFARADHHAKIYRMRSTSSGGMELVSEPIQSIAARAEALADARETQRVLARRMHTRAAIEEALRLEREQHERALAAAQAALDAQDGLSALKVLRGLLRAARAIPTVIAAEVRRG